MHHQLSLFEIPFPCANLYQDHASKEEESPSSNKKVAQVEEMMDVTNTIGEDEEAESMGTHAGDYSWMVDFFQTTIPA